MRTSLKRRSDSTLPEDAYSNKRPKRNITFAGVTVYYFPRTQGFTCVPSQGGCTLGMGANHIHIKQFSSLFEHASEQRRLHRQKIQNLHPNGSSSEDSDSEEEPCDNSGSEMDSESNGFLPVPPRQRRALLKAAGVRKIDINEKEECRVIRTSRQFCGCNCVNYCDPETCSCSQEGIKCQVYF